MSAPAYLSADPTAVVNRQFVCTEANPALSLLCHKPTEQIVGRPAAELFGPQTFHSFFRPQFERAFSGEISYCEAWLPLRNQPRFVGAHCFPAFLADRQHNPVFNADSRPARVEHVVAALRDLTETRRAEETLRRRYLLLSEHAHDIVLFVREADGRIVEANHAALEAYGYTLDEMLSLTLGDLEAPGVWHASPDSRPEAAATKSSFETMHRNKRGAFFPVEVASAAAEVEEDRQVLYVIRDITERATAQRCRQEFVQLAAHEMKTPLATLRGHVQMLLRAGGHDDQERRALAALERQTKRLVRLAQALVDVSHIQSGEWPLSPSPADLPVLVRAAIDSFRLTQPAAPILIASELGSAIVAVDRSRILEVVDNLLDNAVRYGLGDGPIEVAVQARAGEVVVSVRDHGPGISKEDQGRLFEPWYQTAPMVRPTEGMGLGLYISREIIRRHGGSIWVESELGSGSTFSFSLPAPSGGC